MFAALSSLSVSFLFSSVTVTSFAACFFRSEFCRSSSAMSFFCASDFSSADFSEPVSCAFFSSRDFTVCWDFSRSAFALAFCAARSLASLSVSVSWAFLPSSSVCSRRSSARAALSFASSSFSEASSLFSSRAFAPFSAVLTSAAFFLA